jgi:hypothetical protein
MEDSIKSLVNEAKSVLVLLPTKPYFDQVAAGLALYLTLKDKTNVSISCPSPMTVEFNRLIGVNKITQELGNKNMVIRFSDYPASDIERVSYDIENGQFRLTVIPKTKINPPNKDQVQLSYSGVSADTIILIGGVNESHFPAISSKDLAGAKLIHLGTKDISLQNKNVISLARPASSVSEIIASLIKESGWSFDVDSATNLLMGMEDESAGLVGPGVTADTFEIMSNLLRSGGRRMSKSEDAQAGYPPGAIPGQMPDYPSQPQYHQPQRQTQLAQQAPLEQSQTVGPQNNPRTEPSTAEEASGDTSGQGGSVPSDWLQPRIYKGTSVK